MDEIRRSELVTPPSQQALTGQSGRERAARVSSAFAEAMIEAAEALTPDERVENARINVENLQNQTAIMNVLAARTSPQFNPSIVGYASQLANQANLEGSVPPHHPMRSQFGDRFGERDRTDGHMRVPPVNETRGGPTVL